MDLGSILIKESAKKRETYFQKELPKLAEENEKANNEEAS
jgi:hypothetical protein